MAIPPEKMQMLNHARTVVEKRGTVEIVVAGQAFEVEGLQFWATTPLVEAKLSGGRILSFDARDPFALIRNG